MSLIKRQLNFLNEKGAANISHSNRTLMTHLQGTYDILKQWGMDESVCLAGLFHSVYGTDAFSLQPVARDESQQVVALIGERAEHLVNLYCSVSRKTLFLANKPEDILFRIDNCKEDISNADMCGLLHIEYANLIEQGQAMGLKGRVFINGYAKRWLHIKHLLKSECNTELTRIFAEFRMKGWQLALCELWMRGSMLLRRSRMALVTTDK